MQTVNVTGTRRGQTFRRLTTSLLVFVLVCSMTGTPAAFGQGGWSGAEAETVIDLAFDEASLPKVFQSLADAAGLNVLVDPSVSGTVSFKLRDIPVKEAIELV